MKIELDKEADAAFIYFKENLEEGEAIKTISLDENLNVDLDKEGKILGIEVLNASKKLSKSLTETTWILKKTKNLKILLYKDF